MTDRPFIAARIEEWFNRRTETVLRACGWQEEVIAYNGYGSEDQARVLGRIVLVPPRARTPIARDIEAMMNRRGWRNFIAIGCVKAPALITVGDRLVPLWTDRGGYIDHRIPHHGLGPGWRHVTVRSRLSAESDVPVQVIGDDVRTGVVSDLDDTVISTHLPRLLIAAWNSFVLTEQARRPIPGMADFYTRLQEEHPGAPVIYLSTGSFDTVPFLRRFLERHGFPRGAMLMTDWGPTNTGWFRSGQEHKRRSLRQLAKDFPRIKWILVGDDGQHDPALYGEFSERLPKRVRFIAIRQLSPTEQVLAHGSPEPFYDADPDVQAEVVPEFRAPDGSGLWAAVKAHKERKKAKKAAKSARRQA